jgi:hypothetical protein
MSDSIKLLTYCYNTKTKLHNNISGVLFYFTKSNQIICSVGFDTGSPHYMQSFYLQIRINAIEKWPFFWNLSSNLQ